MSECVKPDFRFCGKSVSLSKLPLPVDGVDVNPQGVLPEDVGVARNLDHDGDDRRPSLGCAELSVLIVTLCPCDTEAVGGGADPAGDHASNLLTPNLGKRVVSAGVVVESCSTALGRAVIGEETVRPNANRGTGKQTPMFH